MSDWIEGKVKAIGLGRRQVITRGNQRLHPDVLLAASKNLFGSSEMGDNEKTVSRSGTRRRLRNEPLHRCLAGLLESSCTSRGGIYYRYDRPVVPSTGGKHKRMSSIGHIEGILPFVMLAVSSRNPF